ncbi:MAG: phosphoribosylamine--glycine ligase, partial [Candidatus Cloacimonadota bacterium]|nr:phosphoribosylamine--glycine ligase [Candidatus Cloacimonadota bacterium]
KFSKSDKVDKVFVSPGNPGMLDYAEQIELEGFDEIVEFCQNENIDIVFVGPENPLANGISDYLENDNIRVVGPSQKAAQIEASKEFAKNLMNRYNIPTARYKSFDNYDLAKEYINNSEMPIVIKADGLAAGKGVAIVKTKSEADKVLQAMMNDKVFAEAGSKVVIEEFLVGWEASIFAFTDGENFISTIFSQDHKQAYDNDKGPNTGGMGAFAPVDEASKYKNEVDEKIIKPTIIGMKKDNNVYKGILYVGLIFTKEGPKVIEYNCRFGDPETQVVLSLLKTDLVDISNAIIDNKINEIELDWEDKYAVDVVATSQGYPLKYKKGLEINIDFPMSENSIIYYSGVKMQENKMVTNGGRVMAVATVSDSLEDAIKTAYIDIKKIKFTGITYRSDIGRRKR